MPYYDDLLASTSTPPTGHSSRAARALTRKERAQSELFDAYSKFKQAVERGVGDKSDLRVAFVYAVICLRVARALRSVTDQKTVGVSIYFLSQAAQKLEAIICELETRKRDTDCPRGLYAITKALVSAKHARGQCIEGTADVYAAAATLDVVKQPGFYPRITALLLKPRGRDPCAHKIVEHVLARLVSSSKIVKIK